MSNVTVPPRLLGEGTECDILHSTGSDKRHTNVFKAVSIVIQQNVVRISWKILSHATLMFINSPVKATDLRKSKQGTNFK